MGYYFEDIEKIAFPEKINGLKRLQETIRCEDGKIYFYDHYKKCDKFIYHDLKPFLKDFEKLDGTIERTELFLFAEEDKITLLETDRWHIGMPEILTEKMIKIIKNLKIDSTTYVNFMCNIKFKYKNVKFSLSLGHSMYGIYEIWDDEPKSSGEPVGCETVEEVIEYCNKFSSEDKKEEK